MGRGFTQGKLVFLMALGTDFGSILMAFGTILEHGVPLISSPVPSDDMAMLTQAIPRTNGCSCEEKKITLAKKRFDFHC